MAGYKYTATLHVVSGFLRKVYGILTAQLGLTVLVVMLCLVVPQCKALVHGRSASTLVYH